MNIMALLLFCFYLSLFCFLIGKIGFIRNSGIPQKWLIPLFLLKVAAGAMVGYLSNLYEPGSNDYWWLHTSSVQETNWLLSSPKDFIKDLFHSYHENGYSHLLGAHDSFWNDFRNNLVIKILAILNLITLKNYFINSLFFNLIGFMGHVALFRLMYRFYPASKGALLAGVFLIPTTLFYSSGLHRDQIIFTLIALYFLHLIQLSSAYRAKVFIRLILICSFIFLLRSYLLLAILPTGCLFLLFNRKPQPTIRWGIGAVVILTSVLFYSFIFPSVSPFQILVQKRLDFEALGKAHTEINDIDLQANGISFLHHLPEAINHVLLRPYPWETGNIFHLACSLEMWICLLILIGALIKNRKLPFQHHHYLFLLFCAIGLLFIGYIVPNYGSIIRYRSLYLPFLMAPALAILSGPRKIY